MRSELRAMVHVAPATLVCHRRHGLEPATLQAAGEQQDQHHEKNDSTESIAIVHGTPPWRGSAARHVPCRPKRRAPCTPSLCGFREGWVDVRLRPAARKLRRGL